MSGSALAQKLGPLKDQIQTKAAVDDKPTPAKAKAPKKPASKKATSAAPATTKAKVAVVVKDLSKPTPVKRETRSLDSLCQELKSLFEAEIDSYGSYVAFSKRRANLQYNILSQGNPRLMNSFIMAEAKCLEKMAQSITLLETKTRGIEREEQTFEIVKGRSVKATIDGKEVDIIFKENFTGMTFLNLELADNSGVVDCGTKTAVTA